MGKAKKIKLLDKDVRSLTSKLDNETYSPAEVLGGILMELYDARILLGGFEFQEAHAKVWEVMEAVKKRDDESSQCAYTTYFSVYKGLCKELELDERPAYVPEPEQEPASASETENQTQTQQPIKINGELLTRNLSVLILGIESGYLEPQYFLREGLNELADLASEFPIPKMRFARARQTYANVMDFLGNSGIYEGVESYRQEYRALLERVNGSSQNKSRSNSAGIGRTALGAIREPRRDFRKGLAK